MPVYIARRRKDTILQFRKRMLRNEDNLSSLKASIYIDARVLLYTYLQ